MGFVQGLHKFNDGSRETIHPGTTGRGFTVCKCVCVYVVCLMYVRLLLKVFQPWLDFRAHTVC
jgi:hypothetical protein